VPYLLEFEFEQDSHVEFFTFFMIIHLLIFFKIENTEKRIFEVLLPILVKIDLIEKGVMLNTFNFVQIKS